VVDTVMVGRLGATALGGVAVGGSLFIAVAIFGIGMLLGLDYLVSHAYGGGRMEDAHRSLVQGIYASLGLSAVLMTLLWLGIPHIGRFGIAPDVVVEAVPYLNALTLGLPPLLLFVALRRYLQAIGIVKPIMYALLTANILNAFADYAFVFGRFGFPSMGAEGAGWATCAARFYMLGYLVVYILMRERGTRSGLLSTSRGVDRGRLRELLALGFPAAVQISLEVGVFAMATTLIGRLGATPLGAHQIAIVLASVTFMVPLGVSTAGAVRVGQALGAGDPAAAARRGWAALIVGGGFMAVSALTFAIFPRFLMEAFTTDAAVIATGIGLLRVAALFQLFDGIQVVSTGILRGTGETRLPMAANLVGHWFIGLPTGYYLCFKAGLGVTGLWGGLCTGLIAVASVLIIVWIRRVRRLHREAART
jgi:MATE family multidrug resistance protein